MNLSRRGGGYWQRPVSLVQRSSLEAGLEPWRAPRWLQRPRRCTQSAWSPAAAASSRPRCRGHRNGGVRGRAGGSQGVRLGPHLRPGARAEPAAAGPPLAAGPAVGPRQGFMALLEQKLSAAAQGAAPSGAAAGGAHAGWIGYAGLGGGNASKEAPSLASLLMPPAAGAPSRHFVSASKFLRAFGRS